MTQTALYQWLSSGNARTGLYNGEEAVLAFADASSELAVLQNGCGVFDLNWRAFITATGEDRVRWLNGMVTNNVRDLPLNQGNYDFLLNPQGRIVADMYIYNRGEYLLLETDRSQVEAVLKTLNHFIIMDDVELADSGESLRAIGICGPLAEQVLARANLAVDGLKRLEIRDVTIKPVGISVARGPKQKPDWYEIWTANDNLRYIWHQLAIEGAHPVGAEALEQWRIVQGIPRYGQDIRERDLPQETEQSQALNFSKGCYIGQEIVERIRSRGQVHRKWTGFEFQGSPPPAGKLEANGKVVAEITSTVQVGRQAFGLGYVRRETGLPGSQIDFHGKIATIVDPPFKIHSN